jgi:hypothetical protein
LSLEESFVVEQESLEDSLEALRRSHKALRNFMYSPKFLDQRVKFFKLLGEFQDNLVTLVEVAESLPPVAPAPPQEKPPPETAEEQKGETAASVFGKALVVAVTIMMAGLAVTKGYLHAETLKWIAVATLVLVFLPQTFNVIRAILRERRENELLRMNLQDWVSEAHETIAKIRNKYLEAWMRIRVQNQTSLDLPEYRTLGVDEVLYSRKEQYKVTLPVEFENLTGALMVKCEKSIWLRKGAIMAAASQMLQREYPREVVRER